MMLCMCGLFAQQGKQVTFSSQKLPISQAMDEIRGQLGYRFVFDKSAFRTDKTVEFPRLSLSFNDAMKVLLAGQEVDYVVRSMIVAITAAPKPPEPPRTSDVYVPTPRNAVSATPKPRPVVIVEPLPEPVKIVIEPVVEPPKQYSAYQTLDTYVLEPAANPRFAVKLNLLASGAMLTPNIAFEFATGSRSTVNLSGCYSWIGLSRDDVPRDHKQRLYMILGAEYRRWSYQPFNGSFFGAHAIYARYNVGGYRVPLLFEKGFRYDGYAIGAGISYGYNLALGSRWGAEFNIGLGYMYMDYDQYNSSLCDRVGTPRNKHYFGPTRAGITLTYLIK